MRDASLKEEKEEERAREGAGSLSVIEERIVSDRVERRKSFEDSFLLFTDRPAAVGDDGSARIGGRARNLYAKSVRNFISFFHGARATGGKGKKGGRFCTRQKRRKGANSGAGKRGGHTRRDTRRRREAKRKGSITHIHPLYPSGSSLSPLPPTLSNHSPRKQASNQLPVT